ncbi:MAG: response regulator [Desulfobacteraceae bacterium]|nr:MAG: response regulator [Desulfobacteraceae bacterium]
MATTKILLVDDERSFVETMIKRLRKRGLEIVAAYDGQEGLARLDEDDGIEVVILDIRMPVMDGMAALKEMKSRHPLVEVIMLTGHATVETGIEGMKRGAFDYLLKPCDLEQLIGKVNEAAAHRRHHQEKIMQARIETITLRKP